jgi:hypothetical protein
MLALQFTPKQKFDNCGSEGIMLIPHNFGPSDQARIEQYRMLSPELICQGTFSRHLNLLISLADQDPLVHPVNTDVNNDPSLFDIIICIPSRVNHSKSQALDRPSYGLS